MLSYAFAQPLRSEDKGENPWADSELMQPDRLAGLLKSQKGVPRILCVAFPVLYRQRHIVGAEYAGPGNKPEGIEMLRAAVASTPKDAPIVIYCGCCPMVKCPNVRPAFRALKDAGFKNVSVLNIPENFHTDWVAKGYPTEPAA